MHEHWTVDSSKIPGEIHARDQDKIKPITVTAKATLLARPSADAPLWARHPRVSPV